MTFYGTSDDLLPVSEPTELSLTIYESPFEIELKKYSLSGELFEYGLDVVVMREFQLNHSRIYCSRVIRWIDPQKKSNLQVKVLEFANPYCTVSIRGKDREPTIELIYLYCYWSQRFTENKILNVHQVLTSNLYYSSTLTKEEVEKDFYPVYNTPSDVYVKTTRGGVITINFLLHIQTFEQFIFDGKRTDFYNQLIEKTKTGNSIKLMIDFRSLTGSVYIRSDSFEDRAIMEEIASDISKKNGEYFMERFGSIDKPSSISNSQHSSSASSSASSSSMISRTPRTSRGYFPMSGNTRGRTRDFSTVRSTESAAGGGGAVSSSVETPSCVSRSPSLTPSLTPSRSSTRSVSRTSRIEVAPTTSTPPPVFPGFSTSRTTSEEKSFPSFTGDLTNGTFIPRSALQTSRTEPPSTISTPPPVFPGISSSKSVDSGSVVGTSIHRSSSDYSLPPVFPTYPLKKCESYPVEEDEDPSSVYIADHSDAVSEAPSETVSTTTTETISTRVSGTVSTVSTVATVSNGSRVIVLDSQSTNLIARIMGRELETVEICAKSIGTETQTPSTPTIRETNDFPTTEILDPIVPPVNPTDFLLQRWNEAHQSGFANGLQLHRLGDKFPPLK